MISIGSLGGADTSGAPDWDVSGIAIVTSVDAGVGHVYVKGIGSLGIPGDTNGDGVCDATDYIAVKTHMGQGSGATLADGDFDVDGDVDWDDLQTLLAGLSAAGGADGATIPEPATLALLAFGALAVVRRRKA